MKAEENDEVDIGKDIVRIRCKKYYEYFEGLGNLYIEIAEMVKEGKITAKEGGRIMDEYTNNVVSKLKKEGIRLEVKK